MVLHVFHCSLVTEEDSDESYEQRPHWAKAGELKEREREKREREREREKGGGGGEGRETRE